MFTPRCQSHGPLKPGWNRTRPALHNDHDKNPKRVPFITAYHSEVTKVIVNAKGSTYAHRMNLPLTNGLNKDKVEGRKEDYMYALTKPHGSFRGSSGSECTNKSNKTKTET